MGSFESTMKAYAERIAGSVSAVEAEAAAYARLNLLGGYQSAADLITPNISELLASRFNAVSRQQRKPKRSLMPT